MRSFEFQSSLCGSLNYLQAITCGLKKELPVDTLTENVQTGTRSLQMGEVQESSDAEVAGEQCDTLQVSSETMF